MIMLMLLGLTLWFTFKSAKMYYPQKPDTETRLVSRVQYLAKMKSIIDGMPDGFEKIQANRQWLQEVQKLIEAAQSSDEQAPATNIISLFNFRKS